MRLKTLQMLRDGLIILTVVCSLMRMVDFILFYWICFKCIPNTQRIMLGRTHEKQWIRRSESTSAKREWIWIYESTAFECVLRLNTPQTNRNFFYDWVSCSWFILDEIVFNNYICIIIIETLPLLPSYITYQLYKYILWTWVNLSYYINTLKTHYLYVYIMYIHLYTYDACIYSHGRNY